MITAENITDEMIREIRETIPFADTKTWLVTFVAVGALLPGKIGRRHWTRESARARCAEILNQREEHPAFVANICGTLINHPAHDGVSRWFAACPECTRDRAKEAK